MFLKIAKKPETRIDSVDRQHFVDYRLPGEVGWRNDTVWRSYDEALKAQEELRRQLGITGENHEPRHPC
jgi:hypothetical protein